MLRRSYPGLCGYARFKSAKKTLDLAFEPALLAWRVSQRYPERTCKQFPNSYCETRGRCRQVRHPSTHGQAKKSSHRNMLLQPAFRRKAVLKALRHCVIAGGSKTNVEAKDAATKIIDAGVIHGLPSGSLFRSSTTQMSRRVWSISACSRGAVVRKWPSTLRKISFADCNPYLAARLSKAGI